MSRVLVFGSINMDLVVETSTFPRLGETLSGASFATRNSRPNLSNLASGHSRFHHTDKLIDVNLLRILGLSYLVAFPA